MKVILAKIVSSVCFWMGHGVSLVMNRYEWLDARLYPIYKRLMNWSCDAEDWAGIEYIWHPYFDPDDIQRAVRDCGGPLFK